MVKIVKLINGEFWIGKETESESDLENMVLTQARQLMLDWQKEGNPQLIVVPLLEFLSKNDSITLKKTTVLYELIPPDDISSDYLQSMSEIAQPDTRLVVPNL
tara:strand:+ start:2125 stop:2433 length:309 start_codon:yes stop_codon:yes gene_type:complete